MENAGVQSKSWFKFPMVSCVAIKIVLKTFKSMSKSKCFIDIKLELTQILLLGWWEKICLSLIISL